MFRKPFTDFNSGGFGAFAKRMSLAVSLSLVSVVPLRASNRGRLMKIVVDEFSITPEVSELVVPEGLFSASFESHARVPGVSPHLDPGD